MLAQTPTYRLGSGEAPRSGIEARRVLTWAASLLLAVFVFFICFTFLRPSPYDFMAAPVMLVWLMVGLRLDRRAVVFVALLVLYHVGLLTALVPYLNEPDPVLWTSQSLYLMTTCIFFVALVSTDTVRRFDLVLNAYVASCVFAAACGILSYFGETGILYTSDGRAAGVFEDPNVLGSFLILGVLALLRRLLTGETRHPVVSVGALLLIVTANFVTFSRGSWGALVVGVLLTIAFTFRSSGPRIRSRIVALAVTGALVVGLGFAALMTIPGVAETFQDRFTLSKDYDEGVTGRFGNQIRSIPMLVERPEGFGPLRFRRHFSIEPHNSYVGGFANGGWLGGFAFLGLVIATAFVGVRLCLVASPLRDRAQVVVPAVLMFFAQGFQIDIDHWRHVYLLLGLIWGLECGRMVWLRRARTAPRGPREGIAHAAAR